MRTYKEIEKLIEQLKDTSGEEFDKQFKILLLEQLRDINANLFSIGNKLDLLKHTSNR